MSSATPPPPTPMNQNATPPPPTLMNPNDTPVAMGFRWLFGQEASTVILALMLAAICYGGWKSVTVFVPKHLKQISDGYEKIVTIHSAEIKDLQEKHGEAQEKQQQIFEKTLDRIERRGVVVR